MRIWIDWLPGGIWGVGRVVDLSSRENPSLVREDDWVFRGYEMQDALEAANAALSADLDVSREVGEAGRGGALQRGRAAAPAGALVPGSVRVNGMSGCG